MKVLIDTHTFLWMATEPEKLAARARELCETAELVFSVASVSEIGIKWETGRLPLPSAPREYIAQQIKRAGISILAIQLRHALTASSLPMHHSGLRNDPFDRMMAAQCLEEGLKCVTKDPAIAAYGVEIAGSDRPTMPTRIPGKRPIVLPGLVIISGPNDRSPAGPVPLL